MKQTPKWKRILQIVAVVLYIVALVALGQCAMHGVGALAVILLGAWSNVFLAVFGGVTASIAIEEEHEYGEKMKALLIAERLSKVGAPCEFYEYVDEVAEFCDKDHKCSKCAPDECWAKILKNIAENGKLNG